MRTEIPNWHEYFIDAARQKATRSRDPNTQVGCVIVNADLQEVVTGYNGFVRGMRNRPQMWERPEKYHWVRHAEKNALLAAARRGTPVHNCTAYVTHHPCTDCLLDMIQAGIKRIYIPGSAVVPAMMKEQQDQLDSILNNKAPRPKLASANMKFPLWEDGQEKEEYICVVQSR